MFFEHVLALALGKSIEELRSSMGCREFERWRVCNTISPIGDVRADFRMGLFTANYFNFKRSGNEDRYKPADFMWEYKPPIKEQTPDELETDLKSYFDSINIKAEQ